VEGAGSKVGKYHGVGADLVVVTAGSEAIGGGQPSEWRSWRKKWHTGRLPVSTRRPQLLWSGSSPMLRVEEWSGEGGVARYGSARRRGVKVALAVARSSSAPCAARLGGGSRRRAVTE
jgi:hypothetical protein